MLLVLVVAVVVAAAEVEATRPGPGPGPEVDEQQREALWQIHRAIWPGSPGWWIYPNMSTSRQGRDDRPDPEGRRVGRAAP